MKTRQRSLHRSLLPIILILVLLLPPLFTYVEAGRTVVGDTVTLTPDLPEVVAATIGNTTKQPPDLEKVWDYVDDRLIWNLQKQNGSTYDNVDGLEVIWEFPADDKAKFTLNFLANKSGNYRVNFVVQDFVRRIVNRSSLWSIELEFDEYTLVIDWEDAKGIPGIAFENRAKEGEFFNFFIDKRGVKAGEFVSIDPTITIVDTLVFIGVAHWHTQRHTYTDGNNYYVFYFDADGDGANDPFKVSYSEDGVSWSTQTLFIESQAWEYSIWGNATHIGLVVISNTVYDEDTMDFYLYSILGSGALTEETKTTIGQEAWAHANPNICQDNDGLWWIVWTYELGEAYALKFYKSDDVDGLAWGAAVTIKVGAYAGSVMPIGADVVFIYGLGASNPCLSRVRFSGGSWGSEKTVYADAYQSSTYHSALVDGDGTVHVMVRPNFDTPARRFTLADSSASWVYVDDVSPPTAYGGSLSYEPSYSDFYFTYNAWLTADYVKVQNNTDVEDDWGAPWFPWGTRDDNIEDAVLANRQLRKGMYVASGYNDTGDHFSILAFTMSLPYTEGLLGINVTNLICTNYMEVGGTYTFNVSSYIASDPETLYTNPQTTTIDTSGVVSGSLIRSQYHTFSNGTLVYYFWIAMLAADTGWGNLSVAYSADGVSWTTQVLENITTGGMVLGHSPFAIWDDDFGDGVGDIGLTFSANSTDNEINFRRYTINIDGSLALQTSSTVVNIDGKLYSPTITRDSADLWHVLWEDIPNDVGMDAVVKHKVSTDTLGTAWSATTDIGSNGTVSPLPLPIGDDIAVLRWSYTGSYWVNVSFRYANGTWSDEESVITSDAGEKAGIVVDDGIIYLMTPGYPTFNQYDLDEPGGSVSLNGTVYSETAGGAFSVEPDFGTIYVLRRDNAGAYPEVHRMNTLNPWGSAFTPWGVGGAYQWSVLACRKARGGKFIGQVLSSAGPPYEYVALTMDVPTESPGMNEVEYLQVDFTDGGGNIVNASFEDGTWSVTSDIAELATPNGYVYDYDNSRGYFWFSITILDGLVDKHHVTLHSFARYEDTTTSDEYYSDAFGLYVLGGFADTFATGGAQRILGGDVYEFEAITAGSVRANVTYKNFQHLHTMFRWSPYGAATEAVTWFGVDVCVDHVWYETLKAKIEYRDYWLAGSPPLENYIRYNVTWYYNDVEIYEETSFALLEDFLEDQNNARLWIDLWFNRINASTVIGGRIGSYYYGYSDVVIGDPLILDGLLPYTSCFQDLVVDGEITAVSNVEMTRVWSNLTYTGDPGYEPKNADFNILTWEIAQGNMIGIDTPIFVEPKDPEITQFGFLAPLAGAISWLAKPIWDSGRWVSSQIMLGLNGVSTWLLAWLPGELDNIWAWMLTWPFGIGDAFGWFSDMWASFYSMMGYMLSYLTGTVDFLIHFFEQIPIILGYEAQILGLIFVTYWELTQLAIMLSSIKLIMEATSGNPGPLMMVLSIIWGATSFILNWGMRFLEFVADRLLGGFPI